MTKQNYSTKKEFMKVLMFSLILGFAIELCV